MPEVICNTSPLQYLKEVTGTLGVMLKAKQNHLIAGVKPHIETLTQCGFRLADSTRAEFLRMAGE